MTEFNPLSLKPDLSKKIEQFHPVRFVNQKSPEVHKFSDIRVRRDGTHVVKLKTQAGEFDYHVMKAEDDPYQLPGLREQVMTAVAQGAKVQPWQDPEPEPVPVEIQLSNAKVEAEHVIKLLQLAVDTDHEVQSSESLYAWKRYRLDLELNGLDAEKPDKPLWIL